VGDDDRLSGGCRAGSERGGGEGGLEAGGDAWTGGTCPEAAEGGLRAEEVGDAVGAGGDGRWAGLSGVESGFCKRAGGGGAGGTGVVEDAAGREAEGGRGAARAGAGGAAGSRAPARSWLGGGVSGGTGKASPHLGQTTRVPSGSAGDFISPWQWGQTIFRGTGDEGGISFRQCSDSQAWTSEAKLHPALYRPTVIVPARDGRPNAIGRTRHHATAACPARCPSRPAGAPSE